MSFKMRPFKKVVNAPGALEIPTLPAIVRDAFNRPLSVGDLVIVQTGRRDPFRVTKIASVNDPGVPPNLMEIVVSVTLRFRAVRDQANQEFVRIMEFSETQQQQQSGTAEGEVGTSHVRTATDADEGSEP